MKFHCYVLLICLSAGLCFTSKAQCLINPEEVISFCTETNDLGITYSAGTSIENFFKKEIGCIPGNYAPGGAWFIMQIDKPGDLAILMSHSENADLDFISFGPFQGNNKREVLNYVCKNQNSILINNYHGEGTNELLARIDANGCHANGAINNPYAYDINHPCFRAKYDEYPKGTIADCSSSTFSNELCYISNAKQDEWYLLFISNWSLTPGIVNFRKTGGDATTNCRIIIDAESTGPYCEGETIQLNVNNAPDRCQFMWTGPNGFVSTLKNPQIPNATADNSGNYKLIMYTQEYEAPEVTVPVTVYKTDTNYVKKTAILERGESYTLEDRTFTESGEYTWEKPDEKGCKSIVQLNLTIIPDVNPAVYFSPNGDGVEDLWQIEDIELYPEAIVSIFDRWGELIFQTSSYDNKTNAWDGKRNGKACPSSDYWYVIDIESLDRQKTGHFSLIR